MEYDVRLSDALRTQRIGIGQDLLRKRQRRTHQHSPIVYLSSERAIDTLTAVACLSGRFKMGRTTVPLVMPAGSGDFHLLRFQAYTDLENGKAGSNCVDMFHNEKSR